MSQTETHWGKLRKIDLQGKSIEEYCEQVCKERYNVKKFSSYCKNWKEQLIHETWYKKYFITENCVYEVYEHESISDYEDIQIITPNEDGTYSFVMQFYNGGTCLSEMIEEALVKLEK